MSGERDHRKECITKELYFDREVKLYVSQLNNENKLKL